MRFHVVTLFPGIIEEYAQTSILGRAVKKKLISIRAYPLREFSRRKWKQVDDRPYGGGPGMVLEVDAMVRAAERALRTIRRTKSSSVMIYHKGRRASERKKTTVPAGTKVIITSPSGKVLTNAYAKNLTKKYRDIIIIAGHYEGIDARVKKILKAQEVSTGPYILTGGELPALAIIDATARQIPGVLGKFESLEEGRVVAPEVYTRPEVYTHKGKKYRVPKVLLSGHRGKIEEWKRLRGREVRGPFSTENVPIDSVFEGRYARGEPRGTSECRIFKP